MHKFVGRAPRDALISRHIHVVLAKISAQLNPAIAISCQNLIARIHALLSPVHKLVNFREARGRTQPSICEHVHAALYTRFIFCVIPVVRARLR